MAATKKSFAEAKASLACEGIYLTPEEDKVIGDMIEAGVDADERAARIKEWIFQEFKSDASPDR